MVRTVGCGPLHSTDFIIYGGEKGEEPDGVAQAHLGREDKALIRRLGNVHRDKCESHMMSLNFYLKI